MSADRAHRVILKPHITERTFELVETHGTICFIVSDDASKAQISKAVSVLYKEKVLKVNTTRTIYGKKAFVKMENVSRAQDLATNIGML